jgi:hypothetical protein
MRNSLWLLLVVLLGLAGPASAAGALDALADAAAARRAAIGAPESRAERRALRDLGRVETALAGAGDDLVAEAVAARRAARIVERRFRSDAELTPLLADGISALRADAIAERDRLALWTNRTGDAGGDTRLARGLRLADREFARASSRGKQSSKALFISRACAEVAHTRDVLALAGDPPPLAGDAMPDFSLADVNPASPTHGQQVSPRNHLGKLSAWYFGHSG